MRIIITLSALLLSITIQAQSALDTIRTNIQTKIANLNIAEVGTGILYDRTLPLTNLQNYGFLQGGLTTLDLYTPSTSAAHYFQALQDLNHTDYQNRYPDAETTYNNNAATTGNINIGVLNADFNMFREDAVDSGALLIQGEDSLLYNNPNSNISPYKTYRNAFVATPLKSFSGPLSPTFKLDEDYWKETAQYGIKTLEIDFDDGNGFVKLTKNQSITINYTSNGEKELRLKATFTNNMVKTVQTSFKVLGFSVIQPLDEDYIQSVGSCLFPTDSIFNSGNHTFQGYDESQAYGGRGRYFNHSGTTCLTKPVIIVEGYDPSDGNDNASLYSELDRNDLAADLENQGYDIITLNFEPRVINGKTVKGGTDYIERNAMVLVKLIEMVNASKSSNAEPTKIIGFSMGGLVARYALRYMENNNIPHDVDLYVSVDSPHQGASVPSGVQHTVKLIDDLVPAWLKPELASLEDELNQPATKQMLKYHYNNTSFFNTFYNNLNSMGYPQNTRNIAIINGSMTGTGINGINQKYYEGKAHVYIPSIPIIPFTHTAYTGNLQMNFTKNSGSARVFKWRLKLFGLLNIHQRNAYIDTQSSIGSLENAPGGTVGVDELDDKVFDFVDFNFEWLIVGINQELSTETFSFIPTKSAIDFQGNPNLFQDIYANLVCSGNTPFDSYYSTPSVNEPHMFLSEPASSFIFQEILGNAQDPTGSYVIPAGSYYYVGQGNHTDLHLENSLPGKEPFPETFPEEVHVHQVTPIGATSIDWNLFLDDDNAVVMWYHSGSYLYFEYLAHKTNAEILFTYSFNDECDTPRNIVYYFNILEPESGFRALDDFFLVYPVPANSEINIINKSNEDINSQVKLFNYNGVEVEEAIFRNSSELKIDTSTFNNGIYFLKITSDNRELIKQITIRH